MGISVMCPGSAPHFAVSVCFQRANRALCNFIFLPIAANGRSKLQVRIRQNAVGGGGGAEGIAR
jgi:hypothetical protein